MASSPGAAPSRRRTPHDASYELVQHLATGGMAELYLARRVGDPATAPLVVLKRILPSYAQHRDSVSMFLDEARLASRLNHPNIARVIEVGRMDDTYCYTMEYVHGKNVREILFRAALTHQRIPLEVAAHVIASAATGLHAAHEQRDLRGRPLEIVHRDVSPSNLMVGGDGVVKIVDFGIAKAADRMTETRSGTIKGKTAYLSPEQCRQRPVDRRSDVFSLGIVAWELLTQARLFRHGSDFDTMDAILRGRIAPPSEVASHLPRALDAVLLRALARDPDERFATASELATALESAIGRPPPADAAKRVARFLGALFPEDGLPAVGVASEPSLSVSLGAKTISVLPAEDSDGGAGAKDDREPDTLDDRGPGAAADREPDTLDDRVPARRIAPAPISCGAVATAVRLAPSPPPDVTLHSTLPLGMPQLLAARARPSARLLPLPPPAAPDPIASVTSDAAGVFTASAAGTPVRTVPADAAPGPPRIERATPLASGTLPSIDGATAPIDGATAPIDGATAPIAGATAPIAGATPPIGDAMDGFTAGSQTAERRRDVATTLPDGVPSMLRAAIRARRRGHARRIAAAVALGVTLSAALFVALRYQGAVGAALRMPPVAPPIVVPGSGAAPDVRSVPIGEGDEPIAAPAPDAGAAAPTHDDDGSIVKEPSPPSSSTPTKSSRSSRKPAAPAIDPAESETRATKVQALFDQGQTALSYAFGKQALDLCHQGLQLDRSHAGLIVLCGQASCLLGDAAGAIRYANRLSIAARRAITDYCAVSGMRRVD